MDRDDWWSELAEVLVGFKQSTILNPPTDCIFQTAMAMVIFDMYFILVYGGSGSGPLHGCERGYGLISDGIFEYVFKHILLCWLLFLHKKELPGRQPPQSNSSWPLSGSPWHTKYKRVFGDGMRSRISHMKTSTRLLYVFYRDGTLLYIPWVEN